MIIRMVVSSVLPFKSVIILDYIGNSPERTIHKKTDSYFSLQTAVASIVPTMDPPLIGLLSLVVSFYSYTVGATMIRPN